jgi:activator of HSP90 ATPase
MAKTIQQTVRFTASPDELFDIYMDSKKHAAAVDSTASISRRVGGTFSVFDGYIKGKTLLIVPKRLIVQSWRGSDWKAGEPDSILVLTFSRATGGGQIDLVHANIPDREARGINAGWRAYYWTPWRAHLARTRRR